MNDGILEHNILVWPDLANSLVKLRPSDRRLICRAALHHLDQFVSLWHEAASRLWIDDVSIYGTLDVFVLPWLKRSEVNRQDRLAHLLAVVVAQACHQRRELALGFDVVKHQLPSSHSMALFAVAWPALPMRLMSGPVRCAWRRSCGLTGNTP